VHLERLPAQRGQLLLQLLTGLLGEGLSQGHGLSGRRQTRKRKEQQQTQGEPMAPSRKPGFRMAIGLRRYFI